jgi:hypothetical protein
MKNMMRYQLPCSNTIWSLLLYFCVELLTAAPTPSVADQVASTTSNVIQQISSEAIVFGVLLIVSGLVLAFFGYRLFNFILFLAGAYTGGLIAYIIVINTEPSGGYANRDVIIIVAVLIVALITGLLTLCIWRLGLTLIGGLAGIALGMFILSWVSGGVIQSEVGRIVFLTLLALLGAIVIHFFVRPLLIAGTAIIGAFSFIVGVDIFAQTGFALAAQQFINDHNALNLSAFETNSRMYGMLVGFMATAIIGALFQSVHTRTRTWNNPHGITGHSRNNNNAAQTGSTAGGKSMFWR